MAMTPGWYPDPFSSQGYVRWWDGERWGAVRLPVAPAPPPALARPAARPVPPPRPRVRRGRRAPGHTGAAGAPPARAPFALAPWGSRAGARIIDWVLEGLLAPAVRAVAAVAGGHPFVDSLPADGSLPPGGADSVARRSPGPLTSPSSRVVTFLYQVPQNKRCTAAPSASGVGIRVRPRAVDTRLSWGRIDPLGRRRRPASIGGLWSIVDYLWPLWDKPYQQAIHDKAAKTTSSPPADGRVARSPTSA